MEHEEKLDYCELCEKPGPELYYYERPYGGGDTYCDNCASDLFDEQCNYWGQV